MSDELKDRLKLAVLSVEPPPFLEARIRARLRETPRRSSFWKPALASAIVALAICIGGGIAYQLGHLRLTVSSRLSYISSVSNQVASIMRVGLGDHIHCSVFRKFPANPPSTAEFVGKLGAEFSGLIPIVREQVPADFRLMIAHQCKFQNRKFVHLSLKSDSRLLSVVIARKGEGESFATEELVPALSAAGIPIYRSGAQRFQLAAFESRDYLVYVISDLPRDRNMNLMRAMAPALKTFLNKLES